MNTILLEKLISLGCFAFVFGLGTLIFGYIFDAAQRAYDRRQAILDNSDEFEYKDPQYAVLYKKLACDPIIHDLYAERAIHNHNLVMDGAPQISPTNCTCFKCSEQERCAFAFDPYNMDGDCLMTK